MITRYFEVMRNNRYIKSGLYKTITHTPANVTPVLSHAATRIWQEVNGKVIYIKHRNLNIEEIKVDLKEFSWIKLKAKTYN